MTQDAVQAIERNIKVNKEQVEKAKALDRLKANKDFRLIVTTGYLEKEAVRLVHLKGDPAMQHPQQQANISRDIDAIASLSQYFSAIYAQASTSEKALEADEAELEFIRSEEGA